MGRCILIFKDLGRSQMKVTISSQPAWYNPTGDSGTNPRHLKIRKVGSEKTHSTRRDLNQPRATCSLLFLRGPGTPKALPAFPPMFRLCSVFSCPALPKQRQLQQRQPLLLQRNGLRLSVPHLKPHTAFVSALLARGNRYFQTPP